MKPLTLDTSPRSSSSAWPIFKASLWHDRFWIIVSVAVVLLGTFATASLVKPLYRADSTLLVLLGSEYTYRSIAGENANNAGALSREQILRTEIQILQEDDLHRDVIRAIGAINLYPDLIAPAGIKQRVVASITEFISRIREAAHLGSASPGRPIDLIEAALIRFEANVAFQAVKDGNAIELSFTDSDPEMAAKVLTLLEDGYLKRRRELYLTQEGALVTRAVEAIRVQLEAADAKLALFKKERGINDFVARQAILLNQQGALETDLRLARSQIEQNSARVSQLDQQVRNLPGAYNTLSNPLMLQIQEERSKAQMELQAARAQAGLDVSQLAEVGASLTRLTDDERQMEQLARTRDVLAGDYQASSKVRNEREVTETVELHRNDNVRVLQEARAPLQPLTTRALIMSAGSVLALLAAAGVSVILHCCRGVYLAAEAVEQDTGLRVLISVPDCKRLAKTSVLLGAR